MKKKVHAITYPRIIRFLRVLSCELNFRKLIENKKMEVVPKLTQIINEITHEYIFKEINTSKYGNEEIFIDYAYFIRDLATALIVPVAYAPFGPLRQHLARIYLFP